MKTKRKRILMLSLWWLPLAALVLLVYLLQGSAVSAQDRAPAEMELKWEDDFEDYTPGSTYTTGFPSSNWTHSGLKDMFVYTDQFHSPEQSLKGHGIFDPNAEGECGGSAAYRLIEGYAPMEIDVWIRNGTSSAPPLTGCHPVFGALELSTDDSYLGDQRGLISFAYDESSGGSPYVIYGGAWEVGDPAPQIALGNYQLETWYHVKVRYEILDDGDVKLTYWVDDMDTPVDEQVVARKPFEGNLAWLGLWVGEHVAWHDDVRVFASNVPVAVNDLMLSKSANASLLEYGDSFTYHLEVSNPGTEEATGVVLTDTLPVEFSRGGISVSQGICRANANVVTCDLGTIAADGSATVDIDVTVPSSTGSFTNNATVTHEGIETNPDDNSASFTVKVAEEWINVFLPLIRG